jgi:hypothetical protein
MIHQVRYSVGVALGWIFGYLMLWALLAMIPVMGLFLENKSPWGWVALGGTVVAWVVTSRRYWGRLLDRSPQIELHATFLRAKQLAADVLWRDVQNIGGSQSWSSGETTSSGLVLDVAGRGPVRLDLVGLDTDMTRLYALACAAREADQQRRRAGEVSEPAPEAAPPQPVRTRGHGADELGEEVESFGPRPETALGIWFGAFLFLAGAGIGLWVYLSSRSPWALLPAGLGGGLGVPLILLGVKAGRIGLVLCRDGLRFVGLDERQAEQCPAGAA